MAEQELRTCRVQAIRCNNQAALDFISVLESCFDATSFAVKVCQLVPIPYIDVTFAKPLPQRVAISAKLAATFRACLCWRGRHQRLASAIVTDCAVDEATPSKDPICRHCAFQAFEAGFGKLREKWCVRPLFQCHAGVKDLVLRSGFKDDARYRVLC